MDYVTHNSELWSPGDCVAGVRSLGGSERSAAKALDSVAFKACKGIHPGCGGLTEAWYVSACSEALDQPGRDAFQDSQMSRPKSVRLRADSFDSDGIVSPGHAGE